MSNELLDLAVSIAEEASALALRRRGEGVSVAATKSTATDIVTAVDREVEALIRGRIADARPRDGFYGEESDASTGESGLTWVVDPIDGTVNFLYGIPQWAVSIAVVEGGADASASGTLAGVVANPPGRELFTATSGDGAWLDGRRLSVDSGVDVPFALIATGFGYSAQRRSEQAAVVSALLPQVRDIRRLGAASLDLCGVASGRLDGYFERGLNPWDYAAGALIVREAGGRVGGFGGAPESSSMLIAAPADLFERLEPLLAELHGDR